MSDTQVFGRQEPDLTEFAKIFHSLEWGQVLLQLKTDDNADYYIEVSVQLPQLGFGVCSVAMKYPERDGEMVAPYVFSHCGLKEAELAAKYAMSAVLETMDEEGALQ